MDVSIFMFFGNQADKLKVQLFTATICRTRRARLEPRLDMCTLSPLNLPESFTPGSSPK